MEFILPNRVLFLGEMEGGIRKRLMRGSVFKELFYNHGIPVCIIILKKNRELNDLLLIIDILKICIKLVRPNVIQKKIL